MVIPGEELLPVRFRPGEQINFKTMFHVPNKFRERKHRILALMILMGITGFLLSLIRNLTAFNIVFRPLMAWNSSMHLSVLLSQGEKLCVARLGMRCVISNHYFGMRRIALSSIILLKVSTLIGIHMFYTYGDQ